MKKTYRNILLSVAAGVTGALAYPPMDLSLLAWVFLVPLFFVLKDEDTDLKKAFLYSYLSGVVLFSGMLCWLLNVTIPGMLVVVLIMACYVGVFGVVAKLIMSYSMELMILPFLWVILEYLRAHLLSGFPWGLLAYTQYENLNLIQISDLTGPYGVSFLVCAFNIALFAVLIRSNRRIASMMTVLVFIITASIYGISRADNYYVHKKARVSVIQGNIPQSHKWERGMAESIIDKYISLSEAAAGEAPDLIIWPETAYPYLVEKDAEEISELAGETGIPILAGVVSEQDGLLTNSAMLFSPEGDIPVVYDKIHLVPFGEYIPLPGVERLIRKYVDKPIGNFSGGEEYTLFPLKSFSSTVGMDGTIMRTINFYKLGVLICYEDIFPYISRELVSGGASMLVNITNDAWFGNSGAPRQHMQASVFRAVENRVPVVRAANTGISAFIDPLGKTFSVLARDGESVNVEGYLTQQVPMWPVRTFYTTYGDIFVIFSGVMFALLLFLERAFSADRRAPSGAVSSDRRESLSE